MKKKVNFYISKPEGLLISQETKKFGFRANIIAKDSYSLEEITLIKDKLLKDGLQIEIEIPKHNTQKQENKNYCKCGECLYLDEQYGCTNDTAKVRSKSSKTKLSKGCFWGEKI